MQNHILMVAIGETEATLKNSLALIAALHVLCNEVSEITVAVSTTWALEHHRVFSRAKAMCDGLILLLPDAIAS